MNKGGVGPAAEVQVAMAELMEVPGEWERMYDEDFEEWILLPKLEDLADKAKVQIKRKDE